MVYSKIGQDYYYLQDNSLRYNRLFANWKGFLQICAYWSPWNTWAGCSDSCGGGTRTRNRLCINGEPDDDGCQGSPLDFGTCNTQVSRKALLQFVRVQYTKKVNPF